MKLLELVIPWSAALLLLLVFQMNVRQPAAEALAACQASVRRGELRTAQRLLDRLVGRFPNYSRARLERARLTRSLADYDLLLAQEPGSGTALQERGRCRIQAGQMEAGLADLEKAHRLHFYLRRNYLDRADAYFRLGRLEEAWRAATVYIELLPFEGDGYALRSLIGRARGDESASQEDEVRSRSLSSDSHAGEVENE